MSGTTSRLPARPSLEQLRKQAKELLRDYSAGDKAAESRIGAVIHRFAGSAEHRATLSDAQFVIAREYGFENWAKLARHVKSVNASRRLDKYEEIARDLRSAYNGDAGALERLNDLFPRALTAEQLRALVEDRLSTLRDADGGSADRALTGADFALTGADRALTGADFALADAQLFVARLHGFESWESFAQSLAQPPRDPRTAPIGMSSTPPFYKIDWKNNTIAPGPILSDRDWDSLFEVMKELRITGLAANGQMSDRALARLARLDFVTRLELGGSARLTDDGLKHLAGMPQLEELDLSEYPGGRITDRGLEALRHLRALRRFQMCWQSGISDAGAANLAFCDELESVNLMGTPTGDGAIKALAGKRKLRFLKTGRQVTDAGLALLHEFPAFKTWQGGEIGYSLMSFDAKPTDLLLDGPFTDAGMASLAGLDGLFGLSFFWHVTSLTPAGLAPLAALSNLGFLGCQGELCNDEAMRRIASIPRLRMLMGQGTVASDEGFIALARSQTLEYIWGRECPNLGSRGFAALSEMPALKGLAVSCRNVDEAALSLLPRFRSLRELLPMDVSDEGFRHVGRCEQLENLWCMYCRETGDAATEQIAGLSRLKTYYAGKTRITDRSLEILSRMPSLEVIELYECAGISDAGIALLARLPRLREMSVGGSLGVTREGMAVFPATVRANYY